MRREGGRRGGTVVVIVVVVVLARRGDVDQRRELFEVDPTLSPVALLCIEEYDSAENYLPLSFEVLIHCSRIIDAKFWFNLIL